MKPQFLYPPPLILALFTTEVDGVGSGGNPQMMSSHFPPGSPCQSLLPREIPPHLCRRQPRITEAFFSSHSKERSTRRTSPLCPVSIPHPLQQIPSPEIESSHICQDKGTDRKLVDLEWNQIISEFSYCKRSRLVTINTFDQWSMSIHLMSQFV